MTNVARAICVGPRHGSQDGIWHAADPRGLTGRRRGRRCTPGVSAEVLTKESDELTAVLREIATLPSTPGMKTSLDLANNQWTLVRPSLARGASSPESLDLALRASERMFEALDELFDEVAKAALAFN